jgi:hypothetical protein
MAEVLIRHGTKNVWFIAVLEQKDSSAISNFLRFDACSRAIDFLKSYLAKLFLGWVNLEDPIKLLYDDPDAVGEDMR